jgi:hypothetical protein
VAAWLWGPGQRDIALLFSLNSTISAHSGCFPRRIGPAGTKSPDPRDRRHVTHSSDFHSAPATLVFVCRNTVLLGRQRTAVVFAFLRHVFLSRLKRSFKVPWQCSCRPILDADPRDILQPCFLSLELRSCSYAIRNFTYPLVVDNAVFRGLPASPRP